MESSAIFRGHRQRRTEKRDSDPTIDFLEQQRLVTLPIIDSDGETSHCVWECFVCVGAADVRDGRLFNSRNAMVRA